MSSERAALADRRLQDLFDEAVETGRATYATRDEDEAATLQATMDAVPADENWYRYVVHDGQLLAMRSLYLE